MTEKQMVRRLGLAFLVYGLAVFAGQLLAGMVRESLFPQAGELQWVVLLLSAIPTYLIAIPLFYLLTRPIPDSPQEPGEPFSAATVIRYALMGTAVSYVFSFLGNLLYLPLANRYDIPENLVEDLLSGISIPAIIVFIVILAPVMEELMFRQRFLTKAMQFGKKKAVIAGGLAFGLAHQFLPQFAYTTALGIFWSMVYVRHRSLLLVVLLHAITNLIGSVLTPALILRLQDGIIFAGIAALIVLIVGLILLFRERAAFALALRDDVPESVPSEMVPEETQMDSYAESASYDSAKPQTPESGERGPSLIRNAGYLAYVVFSLTMMFLTAVVAAYV